MEKRMLGYGYLGGLLAVFSTIIIYLAVSSIIGEIENHKDQLVEKAAIQAVGKYKTEVRAGFTVENELIFNKVESVTLGIPPKVKLCSTVKPYSVADGEGNYYIIERGFVDSQGEVAKPVSPFIETEVLVSRVVCDEYEINQ